MPRSVLDTVRVDSPCSVPWESMTGDDHTRFCSQCGLHVFNLSALSREEAETLIREKQGRLCVNYYVRGDGTVMTANCPEFVRARRREVTTLGGLVLAMLIGLMVFSGAFVDRTGKYHQPWLRQYEPFRSILKWLEPPPTVWTTIGGRLCEPSDLGHAND